MMSIPISLPNHSSIASCWQTIGVTGDRSCEKLSTLIHCRNCPIYTQAARQLFDRLQSDDDSTPLQKRPIRSFVDPAEINTSSLALFRIDQQWFALPANLFQQVLTTRVVRPIPHRSNEILQGLVNVHGELILSVCLEKLLGVERSNRTPSFTPPRLIVVEWQTARWSFTVDEFQGIETISADQLLTPPSNVLNTFHTFTHSLLPFQDYTVNCLDEFLLFEALERTALP